MFFRKVKIRQFTEIITNETWSRDNLIKQNALLVNTFGNVYVIDEILTSEYDVGTATIFTNKGIERVTLNKLRGDVKFHYGFLDFYDKDIESFSDFENIKIKYPEYFI